VTGWRATGGHEVMLRFDVRDRTATLEVDGVHRPI
jgi:hypothetical protein